MKKEKLFNSIILRAKPEESQLTLDKILQSLRSFRMTEKKCHTEALAEASQQVLNKILQSLRSFRMTKSNFTSPAFTLAEVLITLTIIGIIAAMVIPSLMADINEKAFNTQRKALYARMSQAIPAMDKIAGYGTLTGTLSSGSTAQSVTADTASETFVSEGLSKVIKMNNMCYSDNITDCNFPESFYAINGTTKINLADIKKMSTFNPKILKESYPGVVGSIGSDGHEQLDTKAAAFETANGESILVYYNPNCIPNLNETAFHYAQPEMCVNFIYDLNGKKAPNVVGKDIGFISVLYSDNPVVVSPTPLTANASTSTTKQPGAMALCKEQDPESRLPNKEELASMFYNIKLVSISNGAFWSGTVAVPGESGKAWAQDFNHGNHGLYGNANTHYVRCVKR